MNTILQRAVVSLTALALTLVLAPAGSSGQATGITYLDNARIRVGVNLDDGGKVTFLAPASGPRSGTNLVFQSEQSYYRSELGQPPLWSANADSATVLMSSNDGRTIYTKAVPQSTWPSPPPCQCTLEQWVTIDGSAVRVRNRLSTFLSDARRYPASWQELPALYTLGPSYRLVTYDRDAPYTRGSLHEYTRADGGELFRTPGPGFSATEHWAALVGDDAYGVGLFEPERTRFAGIAGTPDAWPGRVNGYLTAPTLEILDANATYEYRYTLIVGTISQIRSYAYAHRPAARPSYRFTHDRQSWTYRNATDRGSPIQGALRMSVDKDDPQAIGPDSWWQAKQVPRIYVRGRWHTQQHVAEVFWRAPRLGASATRGRTFRVVNDGLFHTYRVDLFRTPTYWGVISGLRLDPVHSAEPDGLVDITCISWKPCPVDRRAEAQLLGSDSVPFLDDFSTGLDGGMWWVGRSGTGPTVAVDNGRLELGMPAGSTPDPGQRWISANLQTRCKLRGDFDAQVDFHLLEWPSANGVHVDFAVADDRALVRLNTGREEIVAWFPPSSASVGYEELKGSLRVRREDNLIYGYVLGEGGWFELTRFRFDSPEGYARLQVGVDSTEFAGKPVLVAFDNFRISSGRLACS
jgi:hypothetical protein